MAYVPVTQFTRYLPLYFPLQSRRHLARLGLIDPERLRRARQLNELGASGGPLRYPLSPLSCRDGAPLNLMVILIDALRPDVVHPELTPTLVDLIARESGVPQSLERGQLVAHGIFSMMYGLPSTYWMAFAGVQRPPLLLDELRARHYAFVLSAAPGFGSPRSSIARSLPACPIYRRTPRWRTSNTTPLSPATGCDWLGSAARREPFFAFLYYDPPLQNMPDRAAGPLALDDRYPAGRRRTVDAIPPGRPVRRPAGGAGDRCRCARAACGTDGRDRDQRPRVRVRRQPGSATSVTPPRSPRISFARR